MFRSICWIEAAHVPAAHVTLSFIGRLVSKDDREGNICLACPLEFFVELVKISGAIRPENVAPYCCAGGLYTSRLN